MAGDRKRLQKTARDSSRQQGITRDDKRRQENARGNTRQPETSTDSKKHLETGRGSKKEQEKKTRPNNDREGNDNSVATAGMPPFAVIVLVALFWLPDPSPAGIGQEQ